MPEEGVSRRDRTLSRARDLRRCETSPERLIWNVLRNRSLAGLKFRRQHAIGPFVADFYCHESRLAVELDGETHDLRVEHDRRRTQFFESQGIRVVRFANEDVLHDLEAVAIGIAKAAGIDVAAWLSERSRSATMRSPNRFPVPSENSGKGGSD